MKMAEGLRSDAIARALDGAIAGVAEPLYKALALASGLPGPRANMNLAHAFAADCAARGKKVDPVILAMARLPADEARGASGREFLPICGVLALGARAAADRSLRPKALEVLHEAADDLRFRVREAAPLALARIGAVMPELPEAVEPWMDGYFQATAVIVALADPLWLTTFGYDEYAAPIALLHDAFVLARDAPRAAERYPGHKALIEALGWAPAALGTRFRRQIFDRLGIWAETTDPEARAIVQKNLRDKRLSVDKELVEVVRRILTRSAKPPRDPTLKVEGTRGRGRKRGR